ncbi:MAG: hypothetical protein LBJ70_01310 [Holosporales bacterium]|jgi:hypothetical protein|nr:hypothetical protein [Holosporales bacterium]
MPASTSDAFLNDLEKLYEASMEAASFGTALKVKEMILRLTQSQKTAVPDLAAMTDAELEAFVLQIKGQLSLPDARGSHPPTAEKTTRKSTKKS